MTLFIPITKVDAAKRLVYGTLTQEVTDKSGEIYDYDSGKQAFLDWSGEASKASGGKSKGNLRAMHGSIAAGKFTDISFDDANKRVEGCAKVVDDAEWEKVLEGVYTGFSIGGGYAKRWPDKSNPALMRFTPTLAEVSLVDNPCVPTATFEVIKADGTHELRKFHHHNQEDTMTKATETEGGAAAADEATLDLQKQAEEKEAALKAAATQGEQVWKSTISGETFATKAEMVAHNVEQQAVQKASGVFDAIKSINDSLDKAEKADGGEDDMEPSDEKKKPKKAADGDVEKDDMEMAAKASADEETSKKASDTGDLSKAGARHSKVDMERVQALHDHADQMHKCFGEMAEKCAGMHKAAGQMKNTAIDLGAQGERADDADDSDDKTEKSFKGMYESEQMQKVALEKVLSNLHPTLEAIGKRIADLEAQPLPAKGVIKAVAKTEDGGGTGDGKPTPEEEAAQLGKMTPAERAKSLMKSALARPIPVVSA